MTTTPTPENMSKSLLDSTRLKKQKMSVEQAINNAAFCYKSGGCKACKRNKDLALKAIKKKELYIWV